MATTRARRVTTKKIDYSREQEFSDEDLFEDGDDAPASASAPRRRKTRTPKSSATSVLESGFTDNIFEQADPGSMYQDNRPVYTEKGYDPTLPPIRERFAFMPEYEEDGTMKIELIVGRRPIDESAQDGDNESDEDDGNGNDEIECLIGTAPKPSRSKKELQNDDIVSPNKLGNKESPPKQELNSGSFVEFEYLIKYKGRSYLHLEWKRGADLESMNKSAKSLYRRYLKKIAQGVDEELENPDFDPSYAVPEKIIDEAEQEMTIELSDKELLRWEKQREKELAVEVTEENIGESSKDQTESNQMTEEVMRDSVPNLGSDMVDGEEKVMKSVQTIEDWPEDQNINFATVPVEKLRAIINREGPYYPVVEGSENPYADGYVTEPPKKPRGSYILFQCAMRAYYQKKNPQAHLQSELMATLGDAWRNMSDAEKAPFVELADEESRQFESEKLLLEKAQKPNGVWQPLRRCRMVLDRICSEVFADIFLEPVNTADFPDYREIIDSPMDLGTVRKRLDTKKYQACEQFARDMRKIWNNCKIYNMHGSAIWYLADFMSKLFERLYHAWVLEFRERYVRWADPRARPWEHSCRIHDGTCCTPDEKMVLCDHCDGMYGLACLDPPLKKVPMRVWHCPDCKPRLKSAKGDRMLSAVAENAARKRAELGDLPKKKVTQTMYLVKWAGLGYEFCTWETRKDIANDKLIADFHRLQIIDTDEPDMKQEMIDNFLNGVKHINLDNAGGINVVPNLRAQLYAQSRSFQFIKFGSDVPENVCAEIGPKTISVSSCPRPSLLWECSTNETKANNPREIAECLNDIVFRVSRNRPLKDIRTNAWLPAPLTGEYDAIVPITSKGLMMNVGEFQGSVAFLGYRQFPGGIKGPAEERNLIKGIGDRIIAVDGISTIGMSFKDVIALLRESGKNKFAYMRFLESRYSVCDQSLSSVGIKGRYTHEELQKKFISDRQRVWIERINEPHQEQSYANKLSSTLKDNNDDESEVGSEGSFQPESEDEEILDATETNLLGSGELDSVSNEKNFTDAAESIAKYPFLCETKREPLQDLRIDSLSNIQLPLQRITCRSETTRSLAFRLLDIDVGYSSDEAGDEDYAYFLDGVDGTFSNRQEVEYFLNSQDTAKSKSGLIDNAEITLPVKQNEFSVHGDRAKLVAAVALSTNYPEIDDFISFPQPSIRGIEIGTEGAIEREAGNFDGAAKSAKRSTVKVEQISVATGEVMHVWANVETAAATLQLPLLQLKQVLRGEYDEDIGDEVGGYKWCYALSGAKVTAGSSSSRGGKKAKEAWLQFREKLYDPNEPHVYKNGNRLRDYQVDGVNWLASTWYKQQGCILSDEMGLGKTVQIVCYIEHLFRVEKIKRPFLIVVPLSTIEHWRREFEGWTDMVCCVYHDRQRIWRDVMREYEWYYEDRPHNSDFLKFDVLVTTYDTLISDFDVISQIPFRVAVVDEAHRLRNRKGKLLECMREVSARATMHFGFQSRVLMSGTPLQNDLTELWTLLNFIEPLKFSDLDSFQAKFGNMANRNEVEALQKLISPYMLRRVKEDVAKDIPSKEETLIDVELTSIQKQYYRAIFEHNLAFLNLGATRQAAPKLMNIQMELRKVCNHPFLLEGVEHRESDRLYKEFMEKGAFDGKTPEQQQHMLNEHGYIMTSGKMVLLDKLLPKLRQEGHKILIFSQMVKMLDLISEYCEFRGFRYERLDGRVRGTERQKSIDRFEKENDSFLFLLSTRAGGVGINLTAADICIIFDSDWNPQNDVQAQARCHRIGQTKDVRIYRLITSRSFEQEMFERASRKLGLEQAVLGTFEKETEDDKPTQQEMEQLLKKGAYALLEDDNDEITNEFCADDIESILAKRTRTRVVEGTKTASWLNKQGLVVSKSKFTAEAGESLDMDDPLFWQKVMPDFVTPTIMLQKLNDLQIQVEGRPAKGPGRGRGRGRGRPKKSEANIMNNDGYSQNESNDARLEEETLDELTSVPDEAKPGSDNETIEATIRSSKHQLSRKNIRNIHSFISDLKSMMENILEEAEEETIKSDEKDACQRLLLTISVKDKIFSDEQRRLAKVFLKRLEGDRRRRCRTSEQQRFKPGVVHNDEPVSRIRDELKIVAKKKIKRRKRNATVEADTETADSVLRWKKRSSDITGGYLGEDGYLHHSDSEDDWSNVAGDMYLTGSGQKDRISRKEAMRRRPWGADDDAATAAGRAWPVFPRHLVKKVMSSVLDAVIKYDESKGGVFSVPVPKHEFPEYYDQIKKPMDYGTMRKKLDSGEYRSAQAMQKDFVLILQNCRQFNASSSDIVKEAREQHLMRPKFLRSAAEVHNLFLSEDGTVLEIFDDQKSGSPIKMEIPKKNGKTGDDQQANGEALVPSKKKDEQKRKTLTKDERSGESKSKRRKSRVPEDADNDLEDNIASSHSEPTAKRPRIRIKMKTDTNNDTPQDADDIKDGKKMTFRRMKVASKRKRNEIADEGSGNESVFDPVKKKKGKIIKSLVVKTTRAKKVNLEPLEHARDKISIKDSDKKAKNKNQLDANSMFLNLHFWKKRRESLAKTFDAARNNFSEFGPWLLPGSIPDTTFNEIAERTLDNIVRHDKYSVFAEAVTEKEAPGYSGIIKNPMDFGTMRKKVKQESEVTEEAARILSYLPEAYVAACIHAAKNVTK